MFPAGAGRGQPLIRPPVFIGGANANPRDNVFDQDVANNVRQGRGQPAAQAAAPPAIPDVEALTAQIQGVRLVPAPNLAVIDPNRTARPTDTFDEQLPLKLATNDVTTQESLLNMIGSLVMLNASGIQGAIPDALKPHYANIVQTMATLHEGVSNRKQMLAVAEHKARQYKHEVVMPTIGPPPVGFARDPYTVSAKTLRENTKMFNPDLPSCNFLETWKKLRQYGQENFFQQNEYTSALSKILEGKAYTQISLLMDANQSLEQILRHLEELYVQKDTLGGVDAQMQAFYRHAGESIEGAMRRANVMLQTVRHAEDEADWPAIKKSHLKYLLYKMITPIAKDYLLELVDRNSKQGILYDVQSMVTKVHTYEMSYGAAPKTDMPIQHSAGKDNISANPAQPNYGRSERFGTPMDVDGARPPSNSPKYEHPHRDRSSSRDRRSNSYDRNRGRSSSKGRGRSYERNRSSSGGRNSRPNSGDRYGSKKYDKNRRQSRSSERRPATPHRSSELRSKSKEIDTAQEATGKKAVNIVVSDKNFYECLTTGCRSLHQRGTKCPLKSGNQ